MKLTLKRTRRYAHFSLNWWFHIAQFAGDLPIWLWKNVWKFTKQFFNGNNQWKIIDKLTKYRKIDYKNVLEPANIDPEGEFKNKTNEDQLIPESVVDQNVESACTTPCTGHSLTGRKKKSTNLGIFRRSEAVSRSSKEGNQISRSFSTPSKNWSPTLIVSEAIDHGSYTTHFQAPEN